MSITSEQDWLTAIHAQNNTLISQNAHKYNGTRDELGRTGLMIAATQGNVEAIRILMGYEQKLVSTSGETALILAAKHGQAIICKLLVGLERNLQLPNGQDALMVAAQNGHAAVITTIIKYFRLVYDKQNLSAADHACATNNLECLKILLQHYSYSSDRIEFMITVASAQSNTEIFKYLKEFQQLNTHVHISATGKYQIDPASELDGDELQLHNELSGSDPILSQDDYVASRKISTRHSRALFRASARMKAPVDDNTMNARCQELESAIDEMKRKLKETEDKLRSKDVEITNLKLRLDNQPAASPPRALSPAKAAQEIEALKAKIRRLEANPKGGDNFSYKVAAKEIAMLKEELAEKDARIQQLQTEINSPGRQRSPHVLRGTIDESYVERLEDEIMQLRADLLDMKGEYGTGQPTAASADPILYQAAPDSAELDTMKREIETLKEQNATLQSQLAAANKVNAHMAFKSHKSMTEETRHAQRAEVLQQIVNKQEDELKVQKDIINEIQEKLNNIDSDRDAFVQTLKRENTDLQSSIRQKDETIKALRSAASKGTSTGTSAAEIVELRERISTLTIENSRLQNQAQIKDAQYAELTSSLSVVEKIEEKNRSNTKAEVHALRANVRKLTEKLLHANEEIAQLKETLEEFALDEHIVTTVTTVQQQQVTQPVVQTVVQQMVDNQELISLREELAAKEAVIATLTSNPAPKAAPGPPENTRQIRRLEMELERLKVLAEELALSYATDDRKMPAGAPGVTPVATPPAVVEAKPAPKVSTAIVGVQTALTGETLKKDIVERDKRIQCLIAALQNQEQSFKSLRMAMDEKHKENSSVITALESSGETLKLVLSGRNIHSGVMTPTSGAASPRRARSTDNASPKHGTVTSDQLVPLLNKLAEQQLKEAEKNDERSQASLSPRGRNAVASANATVIQVLKNEVNSLKEILHMRDKELAEMRGEEWTPAEY